MHVGQMQSFKVELENVISDKLDIMYADHALVLSDEAVAYKRSLLSAFCSGSALGPDTTHLQWKRKVIHLSLGGAGGGGRRGERGGEEGGEEGGKVQSPDRG
eukprot:7586569-Pyramimonas_sp.AAC.1